jgi:hypothetical protein
MASIIQDISGGASIGDAKSGFQAVDHNGWIKLDGRLKTSLTATQQAAVASLAAAAPGWAGTNIPDATGRGLVQGALGVQIGSSAITQANLPNITLTSSAVSAGTPAGTVSMITHSATAGGFDPSPTAGVSNLQQTDRTPENTIALGTAIGGGFAGTAMGAHSHTVSLGGSNAAYTPAAIGCNIFVYLST